MKVLFPYLARWGAANWTRYHHLLTALARRGHEIIVVQAPARTGAAETNYVDVGGEIPDGIHVIDARVPPVLWQPALPWDKLVKKGLVALSTWATVRAIERQAPVDVLLLYNVPQVMLARATRATVVVDVADDLLAMLAHEAGPWASRVLVPAAAAAWARLLAAADLVITPSTVLAERLDRGVQVLPNGADLAAASRADGTAIRARYRQPLVGYVGAFEYFVDLDLVLDVAARLPGCDFLLVGGGRAWPRVRAAARRRRLTNVYFTGPVPYAAALDHMAALDVALIPFTPGPVADAASPLKLFEYLALRKPVVSTPASEIQRVAADWIVFATSPDTWAVRIRDLLNSPGPTAARSARAYAAIAERYAWHRLAAELERLIAEARGRAHAVWKASSR